MGAGADLTADVAADVAALLGLAANDANGLRLEPCTTSGNNRVYRVHVGTETYIAKRYFSHPGDRRDRLHAEYAFVCYAQSIGSRAVPAPIASNIKRRLALYEFVPGAKIMANQLVEQDVKAAANFIAEINQSKARQSAAGLTPASEACFSMAEHVAMIDGRVERLKQIDAVGSLAQAARQFALEIASRWHALREPLTHARDKDAVIDAAMRLVSPSDFGFHNAIKRPDGTLCFIDFEYAGWDDPAKTIGDFFSQPAVPVPLAYFDQIAYAATSHAPRAAVIRDRARRLLPMFQLKWCCIMMNEFLPVSLERRRFADPDRDEIAVRQGQLAKARAAFERIPEFLN